MTWIGVFIGRTNLTNPHHSRKLLLQPPIRRYDEPDGGRARRSVGQHTVSSMPPSLAGSALKPTSPTLTRGGWPPCRIPTKGAYPLRNSQAWRYPASRLRAPVSLVVSAVSSRTPVNHAGYGRIVVSSKIRSQNTHLSCDFLTKDTPTASFDIVQ